MVAAPRRARSHSGNERCESTSLIRGSAASAKLCTLSEQRSPASPQCGGRTEPKHTGFAGCHIMAFMQ
jgi:hypothetical protein